MFHSCIKALIPTAGDCSRRLCAIARVEPACHAPRRRGKPRERAALSRVWDHDATPRWAGRARGVLALLHRFRALFANASRLEPNAQGVGRLVERAQRREAARRRGRLREAAQAFPVCSQTLHARGERDLEQLRGVPPGPAS